MLGSFTKFVMLPLAFLAVQGNAMKLWEDQAENVAPDQQRKASPADLKALADYWASAAAYAILKTDKTGFENKFKVLEDTRAPGKEWDVRKVSFRLFNEKGKGVEDVEVTYKEAESVIGKYGKGFKGYRDGWWPAAMQAALEKFKDGYYKKENTDKWDSCRKAYESLWVLTGQEATQFMWTADGPPTTDKRIAKLANTGAALIGTGNWTTSNYGGGGTGFSMHSVYALTNPFDIERDGTISWIDPAHNSIYPLAMNNGDMGQQVKCWLSVPKPTL